MSRQVLEAVIGRAVLDKDFRVTLFAEPEVALIEYELTEDELAALKSLDAESLDACAAMLEAWVHRNLATEQSMSEEEVVDPGA